VAVAVWASIAARREAPGGAATRRAPSAPQPFFPLAAPTAALILLLFCLSQPAIYKRFQTRLAETVRDLQTERFSKRDVAIADRAYYENLTRIDRFNTQLWAMYNSRAVQPEQAVIPPEQAKTQPEQANNPTEETVNPRVLTFRNDFLGQEMKPGLTTTPHGLEFHTNRWGMRDKEYEMTPPPGTCRIALLGGSPEVGQGLRDAELWDAALEERLNRENDHKTARQYEILNFAVSQYTALHRLIAFETKALLFKPNVVFYIAHPTDRNRAMAALAKAGTTGTELPYDYLKDVLRKAGIEKGDTYKEAKRRLEPYANEIMSGTYKRIVDLCRRRSIVPVYILLPMLGDLGLEEIPDHLRLAQDAGFKVINLVNLFDAYDKESLRITQRNFHPNKTGHQITADAVYAALQKDKSWLQKLK
jgi:hypothetical protein